MYFWTCLLAWAYSNNSYIFSPVGLKLRMYLIDRLRRNAEITVSCATRLLIVLDTPLRATYPEQLLTLFVDCLWSES